ncbi:MAG: YbbR-like domain-containing protein [Treponema sp.]|nr:YbbR-like domain-containing protein [Treponema sp.]
MKANQFFNKILDKWPVKVCCLILAISMYLFHQASLTEKRSFVLPLQLVEEGAVMHNGDYTSNVTVTVRANTEQISSVHSNQISAYVSLNGISKGGEYNLPVKVKVSDEIMAFDPFEIKVKPEFIKIQVENKDIKYVTIEPMVVGEPEYGYEVKAVTVNPPVAEITGPHTMIENTKMIYTEKVDITDLAKKESFDVNFRPLNKLLTISQKEPVEVTVLIEPMQMEKIFENIEVNVTGLDPLFVISEELPGISFVLEGTVPVLENYTPTKRFVNADLSKLTEPGEYEVPLTYSVPSYLTLKDDAPQSIWIKIEHKVNEPLEPLDEVTE